ncbi:Phosphopantetheine attachment site [Streptomyces sp. yr375]|uniref:acyltransferase domain-containing protein n=1 Tax=Streptomyces sp. yr375 TaxID=1761906 RepID=UPI0008CFB656|nr:acyltransferase domain-containing protein [Streptomyces sp. yr375]SEQ90988.1 Phosphopantetheine attachment site [Streptomyces sp. yr375]
MTSRLPWPEPDPARDTDGVLVPLVLAGPSDGAVAALARELVGRFEREPRLSVGELGWSLASSPVTGLARRVVLFAGGRDEAVRGLRAVAEGGVAPLSFRTVTVPGAGDGRAVHVFSGLGSQWAGMALDLVDASDVFRARLEECARALEPLVPWSLHEVLRGGPGAPGLADVDVVLPVLFAVSVSLSALWSACGVEPAAVVGASVGEIAAAHVAGALTLDEAARVVVLWSRMQAEAAAQGDGELAAAGVSARELRSVLDAEGLRGRVHFAGANGPRSVLFGGERAGVAHVVGLLTAAGVPATELGLGLAAHTPGPAVDATAFLAGTEAIGPVAATVPFYSSLTGGPFETTGLDGSYWLRNLTSEVRFETAVRALWTAGHHTFLEVSPHPVLVGGVAETLADFGAGAASGVVGTLRRGQDGVTEWLTAMARLYVRGVAVDWGALFRDAPLFRGRGAPRPPQAIGTGTVIGIGALSLGGLTSGERAYAVEEFVRAQVAAVSGHGDPAAVALGRGFVAAGFDSRQAVELCERLNEATGLRLPPTLIFDHPTPASVADLVGELLAGVRDRKAPPPTRSHAPGKATTP